MVEIFTVKTIASYSEAVAMNLFVVEPSDSWSIILIYPSFFLMWSCCYEFVYGWSHLTVDLLYTSPFLSHSEAVVKNLYLVEPSDSWSIILHLPFFLSHSEAVLMNFYMDGAIWGLIYTSFLLSFPLYLFSIWFI